MGDDDANATQYEKDLQAEIEAAQGEMVRINAAKRPIVAALNVSSIQDTWKQYNLEQIDLHNASILASKAASDPSILNEDNYGFLIKTAKTKLWMEESKPSLDRSIMDWVDTMKSKQIEALSTFLLGKERPKFLIEIYADEFNKQNWSWIAEKFEEESAIRRALMDKLDVNFLQNIVRTDETAILPSQINSVRLKQLEDQMDVAKKNGAIAKAKLDKYKERFNKYYADFKAKGKSDEEARELADGFAKMLTETESREDRRKVEEEVKRAVGETVAQMPREQQRTAGGQQHLTAAQTASRRDLNMRAQGGFRARDFLRHPTIGAGLIQGYMGAYFRKVLGRYTAEEFTNAVKEQKNKATQKLATKGAGAVVKKVAPGLVAKLSGLIPTGVTQAIAVASLIKSGIGLVRNFFKKEFWKDLWVKIEKGMQVAAMLIMANPLGVLFGALGIFTPLGIVGIIPGFLVGAGIQGVVFGTGSLATAGTVASGATVAGGTTAAAATVTTVGGLGAFFSAAQVVVGIAVGGSILATIVTVTSIAAAMIGSADDHSQGQASKAIFSVVKTGLPMELPNYDGSKTTISYKLVITPGSSTFKVNSIVDEKKRTGKNGDVNLGKENLDVTKLVNNGGDLEITYTFDISGLDFKDTYLINTATIEGEDTQTNEKETQTASFAIRINNPPNQQPYGFPAVGTVSSLDLVSGSQKHWSYFRVLGKKIYGGIDIAGPGKTPVFSTSDGKVMDAGFDNEVGGFVYVQSGHYVVEYLHLEKPSVSKGGQVARGMQIGVTYTGKLPTTRGVHPEHVHYQIALDGGNVVFGDKNNAGSCLTGKIEPEVPLDSGQIRQEWVAPACK